MYKYFKYCSESAEGEVGDCYVEVGCDNVIIRQLHVFNGIMYWATEKECADDRHEMTDQPEIDEEFDGLTPIACEDFTQLWEQAIRQWQ